MPKVVIDTSGVEGRQQYDGPVPPKGLYKALWKRGWWTKSSTQKPMLKVLFILETDNATKKVYNGYPVFHNITYEASTMWKMKELFVAMRAGDKAGVDYDDTGDVKRIGRAVAGKTYVLIHGQEGSWQGQPRLEIATLAPVPKPEGEEDEDDYGADEGDATPFEEAGGVATGSEGEAAGGDPWAAPTESPWDSTGSSASDDEPPF